MFDLTLDINMNHEATVQLTDEGMDIYNAYWKDINSRLPVDSDGMVEWMHGKDRIVKTTLWELFHIFGNHIFLGCKVPFVQNKITLVATDKEMVSLRDDEPDAESEKIEDATKYEYCVG